MRNSVTNCVMRNGQDPGFIECSWLRGGGGEQGTIREPKVRKSSEWRNWLVAHISYVSSCSKRKQHSVV